MKKIKLLILFISIFTVFSVMKGFSQSNYKFRTDSVGFYEDLITFLEKDDHQKDETKLIEKRFELLQD